MQRLLSFMFAYSDGQSSFPENLVNITVLHLHAHIPQLEVCYYGRQFTVTAETETTLKKMARKYGYKYTVPYLCTLDFETCNCLVKCILFVLKLLKICNPKLRKSVPAGR